MSYLKKLTFDQRWWRSKWKLHLSPPRTKQKFQVNCRELNLNNQLNTSWWERNPNNTWLWKAMGFLSTRERWLGMQGQYTKFCLQALTLVLGRRRAGWTRATWGEENWRNSHQNPCVKSLPMLWKPSFSDRALTSKGISLWRTNCPTCRNTSHPTLWSLSQATEYSWRLSQ